MRVATFNINNINKRFDNLLAWLAKTQPDVVSLQELKAEQQALPVNALRTLGYEAVWQGESSWNGVAIRARTHVPVLTCTSFAGCPMSRCFCETWMSVARICAGTPPMYSALRGNAGQTGRSPVLRAPAETPSQSSSTENRGTSLLSQAFPNIPSTSSLV